MFRTARALLRCGQSKTSELIILRYKGAEFGKAKHNVEGQQQADQTKCHNCLQIGICDRDEKIRCQGSSAGWVCLLLAFAIT